MAVRVQWSVSRQHEIASRVRSDRLRNLRALADVLRAGHVDIATGRVLLADTDTSGPIGFQRCYSSAWTHRDSRLGAGWCHSYDQALWSEAGRMVYRAGDGREIEFDTFALPGRSMRPGDTVPSSLGDWHLHRVGPTEWRVRAADRSVFHLIRQGSASDHARLTQIDHATRGPIALAYDGAGALLSATDSGGRRLLFDYRRDGRITTVSTSDGHRSAVVDVGFEYHADGNLAVTRGASGVTGEYAYAARVLVQHKHRGVTTYFGYDGSGSDARCIRTWGDRGAYDRTLSYNPARFSTLATTSLGERISAEFDPVHAPTRVGGWHVEYDDAMRWVRASGPLKREIRCERDGQGRIVRWIAPDRAAYEIAYDQADNILSVRDPLGAAWAWRYDMFGSAVESTDPMEDIRRYEWGNGLLRAILDPARGRCDLEYDEARQRTAVRRADGAVERAEYDGHGRLSKLTDAAGGETTLAYDAAGLLTAVQRIDESPLAMAYDPNGNLKEAVRGSQQRTHWTYMVAHWVASRTDADGRAIAMRYNAEGDLVAVRSETEDTARLFRDRTRRVVEEKTFDGRRWGYTYNSAGELIKLQKPDGTKISYVLDPCGRVLTARGPRGEQETFVYAANGALIEATRDSEKVTREYDRAGRVVRERQGDHWVESTYDPAGDRIEMRSSLGSRVLFVRGASGAVESITVGDPTAPRWRVEIGRDPMGRELERRLPGGVVARWERDRAGRPAQHSITRGSAVLDERAYRWGADGELSSIIDSEYGPDSYEYDKSGRLIGVHGSKRRVLYRRSNSAGDVFRTRDGTDRDYSAGGVLKSADGSTFRYDGAGNLTERLGQDGTRWSYSYSGFGLLEEARSSSGLSVSYRYDALGRRVSASSGGHETRWIWDGDVLLHEISSQDGVTTWVVGPDDGLLMAQVRGREARGVVVDHLGVPLNLYDAKGQTVWTGRIDIYGKMREEAADVRVPWRFPGQYFDAETGLSYVRTRYFDPVLGRYITPNALGLFGGTNAYRYVHNPVQESDPWGLMCNAVETPRPTSLSLLLRHRVMKGADRVLAAQPCLNVRPHGVDVASQVVRPERCLPDDFTQGLPRGILPRL